MLAAPCHPPPPGPTSFLLVPKTTLTLERAETAHRWKRRRACSCRSSLNKVHVYPCFRWNCADSGLRIIPQFIYRCIQNPNQTSRWTRHCSINIHQNAPKVINLHSCDSSPEPLWPPAEADQGRYETDGISSTSVERGHERYFSQFKTWPYLSLCPFTPLSVLSNQIWRLSVLERDHASGEASSERAHSHAKEWGSWWF